VWFPLLVYALTRAADAVFIVLAGRSQILLTWREPSRRLRYPSPADPGYGVVASNWDGWWYRYIAEFGYPEQLPIDALGQVPTNPWAFFPLYPMSVRGLMNLTGLPFTTVGPALNLVLGALAILLLHRLLSETLNRFAASVTTLLTCTYMAAPAMQLAYTESLALLLICLALWLLRHRHYAGFALAALALALTRPIALALAPVVVAHWLARRRDPDPASFPTSERVRVGLLLPWCVAVTGLWPAIAAVVTGRPTAYLDTLDAWSTYRYHTPVLGWIEREWRDRGWFGALLCVALPVLLVVVVRRSAARAWGPEVRTWAWAYPAYLFAVTAPSPSIVRYLLLAFPLMWPVPDPEPSRLARRVQWAVVAVLAVGGLLLQWQWISQYVVISNSPHRGPFP
jgi:hypothetical protein